MLRFLKYIFLIFGGLALSIMIFFYLQNKEDLKEVWNYKNRLSYEVVNKNCKMNLYGCFVKEFSEFSEKVSLTGLSLGLKLAFNFLEDYKLNSSISHKDIDFALKHLEINNIVISKANNRFHGFDNLYGGYIGKMIDFLSSAKEFSDNLIIGLLKSDQGFSSIHDTTVKKKYLDQFEIINNNYKKESAKIQIFIEKETAILKNKYER